MMKSEKTDQDLLNKLEKSVFDYDMTTAEHLAKQVVEGGMDLLAAIDCLTRAITEIGDRFGSGELFLPEVVGAGRVVDTAMALLEEEMKRTGQREKKKEEHLQGKTAPANQRQGDAASGCGLGRAASVQGRGTSL